MNSQHYVVIMAGGIGTRFWPLSRTALPKQFLDLLGTGRSLLQDTYDRFSAFIPADNIYVVTNQVYRDLVLDQLPDIVPDHVLLEPVGRNTAPCIAYASAHVRKRDPEGVIFVAASDHLILKEEKFRKDAITALDACTGSSMIMTLGIRPTRPDTGYGYIQYQDTGRKAPYYKSKTFTEKPSLEIAQTFVESGDFVWNSGMFVFSVDTIQKAYETYLPDMADQFDHLSHYLNTPEENHQLREVYAKCQNISIDFGVMERAQNVFVIPTEVGWSDLGTWRSMYEKSSQDAHMNAIHGQVSLLKSSGNLIRNHNHGKLVMVQGLTGMIVVDTPDVLMICPMDQEQAVREMVKEAGKLEGPHSFT